jgi:hypothetical protein
MSQTLLPFFFPRASTVHTDLLVASPETQPFNPSWGIYLMNFILPIVHKAIKTTGNEKVIDHFDIRILVNTTNFLGDSTESVTTSVHLPPLPLTSHPAILTPLSIHT